ncbi:MAG: Na+/H+ antiporter NhaA [Pseudomonadota bacterium]
MIKNVAEKTGQSIKSFIKLESASGILLIMAAILAMAMDNSPLAFIYDGLLSTPAGVQVGGLEINKPLLLWINDGLMAVFFFLIGLEIKREIIEGELSSIKKASLPVVAAIGGLIVPALIFFWFNMDSPETLRGWGVPVATDIAFALGVLSLLGSRAPTSLKILLLSLAIIDDIAAILIIAIFYTENLSFMALMLGGFGFASAVAINIFGVRRIAPYILIAIFMWICVLKSGVHATIAGVLIALTIPIAKREDNVSPLKHLEHMLHPWVAFFIMPIFAFANAGVALKGLSLSSLAAPLPTGIMAGLFFGKQIGVFLFIALGVLIGLCRLPEDIKWRHIYGLSLLCGIGFTMSLFIGTLAFDDPAVMAQVRLSILIASGCSAIMGFLVLYFSGKNKA